MMHLRMCSFYNKLEGSNGGKERQNRVPYCVQEVHGKGRDDRHKPEKKPA